MTHKFSVGQEVVFTQGASFIIRVPTRCKVTRLLPKEDTQYHIQFGSDSQQRMAPESQLREIPLHRAVHLLDADAVRTGCALPAWQISVHSDILAERGGEVTPQCKPGHRPDPGRSDGHAEAPCAAHGSDIERRRRQ
jgi:hypothetical protein